MIKSFQAYFSADQIISLLCKFRIKYAKHRHKAHLMRDISIHPYTLKNLNERNHCPPELSSILPSRRLWKRINIVDRRKYNSTSDIAIESLRRTIVTVHCKVREGAITPPLWYTSLTAFIKLVQARVNSEDLPIQPPTIIPVKKENNATCRKFRPISQYSLVDRIIIGQTARYLTVVFDDQLLDCAYAFRAKRMNGVKTHHDTIEKIISYKKYHKDKDIFVAECDIKKFFDCVNHDHIKEIFYGFVERAKLKGILYDDKATIYFNQYLDSYAFNLDVFPLKNTDYFTKLNFEGGEFEWPEKKLKENFYGDELYKFRIGVPQGGALSCLISNLLLHNIDEIVLSENVDKEIEYLRFCDDMILLGTNEESCKKALLRYVVAINNNYLLIHEPKAIDTYGKSFFNSDISKSKKPYEWAHPSKSINSAPWISFVGYQIRFDGVIRVRKKSLQKEVKKQQKEANEVLRAVHSKDVENLNNHSRKSRKQQLIALESRLISMSVGRFKLYNYNRCSPSLCWTNGFKRLTKNGITKSQLRLLDSRRNQQLFRVRRALSNLSKKAENPDLQELPTKYFGAPFSYFGFLNRTPKNRT